MSIFREKKFAPNLKFFKNLKQNGQNFDFFKKKFAPNLKILIKDSWNFPDKSKFEKKKFAPNLKILIKKLSNLSDKLGLEKILSKNYFFSKMKIPFYS